VCLSLWLLPFFDEAAQHREAIAHASPDADGLQIKNFVAVPSGQGVWRNGKNPRSLFAGNQHVAIKSSQGWVIIVMCHAGAPFACCECVAMRGERRDYRQIIPQKGKQFAVANNKARSTKKGYELR
jgi:hypothetical protein